MSVLREAQQNKKTLPLSFLSLPKYTKKQKAERVSARSFVMRSFASQKDWIGGTASCGVTLVHDGVLTVGSPHPSASRPPSPQGKALGGRAFPEGEGGPAKPGRMRATSRKHSVVYQRNTVPSGTTNKILWQSQTPHKSAGAFAPARQLLFRCRDIPHRWRRFCTERTLRSIFRR